MNIKPAQAFKAVLKTASIHLAGDCVCCVEEECEHSEGEMQQTIIKTCLCMSLMSETPQGANGPSHERHPVS